MRIRVDDGEASIAHKADSVRLNIGSSPDTSKADRKCEADQGPKKSRCRLREISSSAMAVENQPISPSCLTVRPCAIAIFEPIMWLTARFVGDINMAIKYNVGGVALDRPFKIRRLGHFGFNAADLEASRRFYFDLLGFFITEPAGAGYFGRHAGDHHSFALFDKKKFNERQYAGKNATHFP